MTSPTRLVLPVLPVLLATVAPLGAACSGDDGSGDPGSGGSGTVQVSNDPGRVVEGCYECTDDEYCLVVSGEQQVFHCAESGCGQGCECLIADGTKRLEVCQRYSCQVDSGILYCYED